MRKENGEKNGNQKMISEALQNPYFVNTSFDKTKIVWALKFQKKGGGNHVL